VTRRDRRPLVACAIAIGASMLASTLIAGDATALPIPASPSIASVPPSIAIAVEQLALEPPAPPEPPVPAGYVAQRPTLDPECIGWHDDATCDSTCAEATGFPAISDDRRLIVDVPPHQDGLRGHPGLMVMFIEVATGTTVRTVIVLDANEWNGSGTPALRRKIRSRTAAVQRELATAGYRSLHALGENQLLAQRVVSGDLARIHGNWNGTTIAIVDPAARTVIGRHAFTGPRPASTRECRYHLHAIEAWWDPVTSVGFGRQHYASASDLCDSPIVEQVFEL
jgi:hypothetical protein